jgi:hypothetical protein
VEVTRCIPRVAGGIVRRVPEVCRFPVFAGIDRGCGLEPFAGLDSGRRVTRRLVMEDVCFDAGLRLFVLPAMPFSH